MKVIKRSPLQLCHNHLKKYVPYAYLPAPDSGQSIYSPAPPSSIHLARNRYNSRAIASEASTQVHDTVGGCHGVCVLADPCLMWIP